MTESVTPPDPPLQLRPPEFIATASEPFANDRLDRQPRVRAFCRRIHHMPGPAVLAVCGDFGDGKSAFLRMCVAHLRNQGTAVVEFNAWLQGHTEDPLRDLISVLSNDLDRPQTLQDLLRRLAMRGVGKVTGGLLEPEDFERQTAAVIQEWDDLNTLRKGLQSTLAETVRDRNGKLVVLIDELDRCLPKYALGVLNAARNLLDTPGVVVVLGLNHREIAARIRQLYGSTTEAETFLGRFVDYSIDLRLPNAETGGMDQFLDGVSAIANTDAWLTASAGDYTDLMIKMMVDRFGLSLRDTQQLVHRVAVSLKNAGDDGIQQFGPASPSFFVGASSGGTSCLQGIGAGSRQRLRRGPCPQPQAGRHPGRPRWPENDRSADSHLRWRFSQI